ncbi:MAG: hypothetical protein P1Q69_21070 [Candidatus Thorarchaeota archaeon]|nr:hypothetical protein [Candidatus Thorarchaeota archaeon]
MYLEELNLEILKLLHNNWNEVISLDLETQVEKRDDFLTDEYILGVSLACRKTSEMVSSDGVNVEVLILEELSEDAELELLKKLNLWLGEHRSLGVIGYGLRGYDIPLLLKKLQKYRRKMNKPMWKIIDALQQAAHVDLYAMLKTWYSVKNLRQAIESEVFEELPLRREKELASDDFEQKGKDILRMWKRDRNAFIRYAEADAFDTLLIAEHILKTRK